MQTWFDVALVEELQVGQAKVIDANDISIAVYNIDGEYYALQDICSHDNVPILACGLSLEETVDGDQVICPRHGARFEIKTGKALTPPAYEDITTFPIRIENGMVQVQDNRCDLS